jgi:hypothetical protein
LTGLAAAFDASATSMVKSGAIFPTSTSAGGGGAAGCAAGVLVDGAG